jgi:transcriptional regulator NrdR family protein
MQSIRKRSGQDETFQTDKIRNSMRNAGVSQEVTKNITSSISHHEGITTSEVRNRVIGGIKNREPEACRRYESHPKKPHQQ